MANGVGGITHAMREREIPEIPSYIYYEKSTIKLGDTSKLFFKNLRQYDTKGGRGSGP